MRSPAHCIRAFVARTKSTMYGYTLTQVIALKHQPSSYITPYHSPEHPHFGRKSSIYWSSRRNSKLTFKFICFNRMFFGKGKDSHRECIPCGKLDPKQTHRKSKTEKEIKIFDVFAAIDRKYDFFFALLFISNERTFFIRRRFNHNNNNNKMRNRFCLCTMYDVRGTDNSCANKIRTSSTYICSFSRRVSGPIAASFRYSWILMKDDMSPNRVYVSTDCVCGMGRPGYCFVRLLRR